jgi:hypothetical protein
MIGGGIGAYGIGGRAPISDIREGQATIAATFTISPISKPIHSQPATIAASFTVSGVGSVETIFTKEITDTVTHIQLPVDYALAGEQHLPELKSPKLPRNKVRKIFGE